MVVDAARFFANNSALSNRMRERVATRSPEVSFASFIIPETPPLRVWVKTMSA
jgi:hypothetical protein